MRPATFHPLETPVRRVEDDRLVRGAGCFVADIALPNMAHAMVLRSQIAFGRIVDIDVQEARRTGGVLAVLTGRDVLADGLGGIPWEVCPPGFEPRSRFQGDPLISAPQPVLAQDFVRYVGEPVAFVVAETLAQAQAACEHVRVTIDEQTPCMSTHCGQGQDRIIDETRRAFSVQAGDARATEAAFRSAQIFVEIETHIPRLVAAPMETRGYLADYQARSDNWTVYASAGKPHTVRDEIARSVLHVDPASIHIVAPDVGGGFGAKNVAHAEMALVLWAARKLERPVRWIGDRQDAFLSDMQGRDNAIYARLAADSSGNVLGIQYRSVVNLGAYLGQRAVVPCISGLKVLTGPYKIPAAFALVEAVHTNSTPTCPYRGAGAPETAFVLERLMDLAACRLGLDPIEMRRRNLLGMTDMPRFSPTGSSLHAGDYHGLLGKALERADQFRRSASVAAAPG